MSELTVADLLERTGGRRKTRTQGELVDLRVKEISAVDSPANRRRFLIVKAVGAAAGTAAPSIWRGLVRAIGKALGWSQEQIRRAESQAETFDDMMARRRIGQVVTALHEHLGALMDTLSAIAASGDTAKAALVRAAIEDYVASVDRDVDAAIDQAFSNAQVEEGDPTLLAKFDAAREGLVRLLASPEPVTRAEEDDDVDEQEFLTRLIRDLASKREAPGETAEARIAKRADELMRADRTLTRAAAEEKALDENPALYEQYLREPHAAPRETVDRREVSPAELEIEKRASELRTVNPQLSQLEAETKVLEQDPQLYDAYNNDRRRVTRSVETPESAKIGAEFEEALMAHYHRLEADIDSANREATSPNVGRSMPTLTREEALRRFLTTAEGRRLSEKLQAAIDRERADARANAA